MQLINKISARSYVTCNVSRVKKFSLLQRCDSSTGAVYQYDMLLRTSFRCQDFIAHALFTCNCPWNCEELFDCVTNLYISKFTLHENKDVSRKFTFNVCSSHRSIIQYKII